MNKHFLSLQVHSKICTFVKSRNFSEFKHYPQLLQLQKYYNIASICNSAAPAFFGTMIISIFSLQKRPSVHIFSCFGLLINSLHYLFITLCVFMTYNLHYFRFFKLSSLPWNITKLVFTNCPLIWCFLTLMRSPEWQDLI